MLVLQAQLCAGLDQVYGATHSINKPTLRNICESTPAALGRICRVIRVMNTVSKRTAVTSNDTTQTSSMPKAGDFIENPVTGETMRFLMTGGETAGQLLRIDMGVRPGGFVAGEHIHPHQEEHFLITSGQITLRLNGQERRYTAGEHIIIPPGTPHVWWNSGDDQLRVILEFCPAGRFAEFVTTFFALARGGKTNRRSIPTNPLQLGVTFAEYRDVIIGTSPPWVVQQLLFAVLNPLGRLLGYRPDVPYPGL